MSEVEQLELLVSKLLLEEFSEIAFGEELKGSTDLYKITPCVSFTVSGEPYPVYGIINRLTSIREADAGQYDNAKEFAAQLTARAKGEGLPGLGKKTGSKAPESSGGPRVH